MYKAIVSTDSTQPVDTQTNLALSFMVAKQFFKMQDVAMDTA